MKFGVMAFAVGTLAMASLGGCSRHKQEAVMLSNKADLSVELDPGASIAMYKQATKLDPTNHRILYKLAKAHKLKEAWPEVASTLARATDLAPTFANYWLERAWALEKQAEAKTIGYDECKESYAKCIEADPNRDECYYRLATAHLWTDKEQDALQNYTKAIEHRPDNIGYYTRLADLYIRLDHEKEAEQLLNAAKGMADPAKDKKSLSNVHTLLAKVYRDTGDIAKMVSELEAAKAIFPEDPGLLFSLGMAYGKQPAKKAEALELLKGFSGRACGGQARKKYKSECEQATSAMSRLKRVGG